MSDRSLRLDPNGHPHIVYGGDHLYYAWHDGAYWHYETVDHAPGVGNYAALAFDTGGHPHISYYDRITGGLKYAYQDAAGWHTAAVETGLGHYGGPTSLAIDGSGYPRIIYSDELNSDLKYAYLDSAGWHFETVDSHGNVAAGSLALDTSGVPHISYIDYPDQLKYATLDASGWYTQTLDAYGGWSNSLALDDQGYPHISYVGSGWDEIKYAFQDGSGWHTQSVSTYDDGELSSTSVALDVNGDPHISYGGWSYVSNTADLMYAYLATSGWLTQTVHTEGDAYTSIALESNGRVHLTSYDIDTQQLTYASQNGSNWQIQSVDRGGDPGRFSSLMLDAGGLPHIGHVDFRFGQTVGAHVSYVNKDLSGWQTSDVEVVGFDGGFTSLGLDGNDVPFISYYSGWDDHDLRCATEDVSGWHIESVETGIDSFYFSKETSLRLDDNDYPHISYLSLYSSARDLKYAYLDVTGWISETVDAGLSYGSGYSSLALDSGNVPHISYLGDGELRYAYRDAVGWNIQVVDSEVYAYTSLALDGDGDPHISYFNDNNNGELKYAYYDGSSWHIETLDTGLGLDIELPGENQWVGYTSGGHPSLALDANGRPHISYYDNVNYDLKYAFKDAGGWHIQVVDSQGYLGTYTSLALDANGLPRISYYDWGNDDLKYAFYVEDAHFVHLPFVNKD